MKKLLYISLLATSVLVGSPNVAFAWDFSCSPRETTDIVASTPDVLLMLDRSGSMDDADGRVFKSCKVCEGPSGYFEVSSAADCTGGPPGSPFTYHGTQQWAQPCGEADKWEQSVDAIDALTFESQAATPELARFGLGLYHSTSSWVAEACEPANHSDITNILGPYDTGSPCPPGSTCPGGNTPTSRAIRTAKNSACISGADPMRPTATILINDGHPTRDINGNNGGANNYRDAVEQACEHRQAAPLYIVGLGAGTDEDFNNILAAAGGTGTCMMGGAEVDPCDNVHRWASFRHKCSGSIQANNGDALLEALTEITAALACTFPVNFTNSGVTEVPEDPTSEYEYLYVDAFDVATGSVEQIHYYQSASASPRGEGYKFTGVPRRFVQFTEHYCDSVRRLEYSRVSTQLACLCQEETGTRCDVPNWEARDLCPEGTWQCIEGVDFCEPDPECCVPGPCDTGLPGICAPGEFVCEGPDAGTCVQTVFPEEEVCDGLDNDCDGEVDEGITGSCTVPGAEGRCGPGEIACIDGQEVCNAIYDPMPELCNGLDDDCDGDVDNIRPSWERPDFSGYTATGEDEGKACRFISTCSCPGGATDYHAGDTFREYLASWDPVCQCGEGLGPPAEEDPIAKPTETSAEPASCRAAPGGEASFWLLVLGSLVFLGRRR